MLNTTAVLQIWAADAYRHFLMAVGDLKNEAWPVRIKIDGEKVKEFERSTLVLHQHIFQTTYDISDLCMQECSPEPLAESAEKWSECSDALGEICIAIDCME